MTTRSFCGGNAPVYKLPSADGTTGQVLKTDGNGTVSWQSDGGGGSSFTDISVSGNIERTQGNYTQTTAITSAVNAIDPTGLITCFDLTASPIVPGAFATFTVNCTAVDADSLVFLTIQGHYNVAAGYACANVNFVQNGSFQIRIASVGSVNLTGQLVIAYSILRKL